MAGWNDVVVSGKYLAFVPSEKTVEFERYINKISVAYKEGEEREKDKDYTLFFTEWSYKTYYRRIQDDLKYVKLIRTS